MTAINKKTLTTQNNDEKDDDNIPDETERKRSIVAAHLGLEFDPRFAPPQSTAAGGVGKSLKLLFVGAVRDVKERNHIFSRYGADRVLDYFDGVVGLVSVFLYEELDYNHFLNVKDDPRPLLLSLLCFFHVMVFWINIHHFFKFSADVMTIWQVWLLLFVSLGLVFYLVSLTAWIENGDATLYYIVNTTVCFILSIFNYLTPIDESANYLYRLYHRLGPIVATVWYGIATILKLCGIEKSIYMVYIAPFTFMLPMGAQTKNDNVEEVAEKVNLFRGALQDFSSGNIFSPYLNDRILDYFDAVVGLATVFLFIETRILVDGGGSGILAAALLCFFHIMVYWLVTHHSLKFSPPSMSVLQVWLLVFYSLGSVFYPLCLTAWIEDGFIESYYVLNLLMISLLCLFTLLTEVEQGRSNSLYRVWHKFAPIVALTWYSVGYILLKFGKEQRWMIIMAPFCFMFPLGGKSQNLSSHDEVEKDDEISSVHYEEKFFDCSENFPVTDTIEIKN